MDASIVIDRLGGPSAVATLCECEPQAVSQWKKKGIPKARLLYLKAVRPEVFLEVTPAATVSEEAKQPALACPGAHAANHHEKAA